MTTEKQTPAELAAKIKRLLLRAIEDVIMKRPGNVGSSTRPAYAAIDELAALATAQPLTGEQQTPLSLTNEDSLTTTDAPPTRSQKLRDAGYTRRPTWRSLPSDDDEQRTYPLPDDLYPGSKDWITSDYAGRVEWLHMMCESRGRELDMWVQQACAEKRLPG